MSSHRRLRIAVWHNLPSGGGKRAMHDHVRGLVARGHHVEAWCSTMADQGYMPLGQYCPEHTVPLDLTPPPCRSRLQRLTQPYREAVAAIEAMNEHCRICGEQIRSGNFDLLFANTCLVTAVAPIARYVDIPSVLYLQEPYRFFYEAMQSPDSTRMSWVAPATLPLRLTVKMPLVTRARWRELRRQVGIFADDLARAHGYRVRAREELLNAKAHRRVLCNSYFSRESIIRCYGIDAKVCYLGIDCDSFWPTEQKRPYVVGLGSLQYNKRAEAALRAVAAIEETSRPELVWVGNRSDPSYEQEIITMARALGVRLTLRQLITQEELVETLASAAAMIYTPLLEPFGYAPLEANACGTAVVGWAEGGVRESLQDGVNGIVVDPEDYEATAQALLRYVQNLELAREEGLQARRHVEENWALAQSIDRLEHNLLDCLENRAASFAS